MDSPILTYDESADKLVLKFPGWNRNQVDSIRENFICWSRKPRDEYLIAEPLALAMWEIKETFPKLEVSEQTKFILRGIINLKAEPFEEKLELDSLYDIQRKPTARLHHMDRAIVTAAPGLGKTIIALTALRNRYVDIAVIVVPLTSVDGWAKELREWYIPKYDGLPCKVYIWKSISEVEPLLEDAGPIIVLTTPNVIVGMADLQSEYGQGLAAIFFDATSHDSFLILDESFLYQNRKANRTNVIEELATYFSTVWLLSGMPVSKVNDDLFTQLKILYPKVFRSYWKFVRRYCLLETNFWGTKIVGNKPDAGEKLKRDLIDIIIPCEYPKEIPQWIPSTEYCPMTPQQAAIYQEAKEKLMVQAKTLGSDKGLTIKSLLTLTTRLLQIASNPAIVGGYTGSGKWDRLLELLNSGKSPCLVWVKFIKTAHLLERMIEAQDKPWRVAVLTGATKPDKRYKIVEQFQNGEIDILILNAAIGKYSLTLTAAKVAYYLERDYDGEAYYQSLYRARRITSEHPVEIVSLLSTYPDGKPTIDQVVHNVLLERSQNAQLLTVGELLGSC